MILRSGFGSSSLLLNYEESGGNEVIYECALFLQDHTDSRRAVDSHITASLVAFTLLKPMKVLCSHIESVPPVG